MLAFERSLHTLIAASIYSRFQLPYRIIYLHFVQYFSSSWITGFLEVCVCVCMYVFMHACECVCVCYVLTHFAPVFSPVSDKFRVSDQQLIYRGQHLICNPKMTTYCSTKMRSEAGPTTPNLSCDTQAMAILVATLLLMPVAQVWTWCIHELNMCSFTNSFLLFVKHLASIFWQGGIVIFWATRSVYDRKCVAILPIRIH
jgi:hypothetical protein